MTHVLCIHRRRQPPQVIAVESKNELGAELHCAKRDQEAWFILYSVEGKPVEYYSKQRNGWVRLKP